MEKILLFFVTIFLANTATMALTLNKAHILSHKEWTDVGIKAVYKEASTNLKLPVKKSYSWEHIYSLINAGKGFVGKPANVSSEHYINITNDSNSPRTYSYGFSDCFAKDPNHALCAHYYETVQIEASGSVSGGVSPELQVTMDKPGTYVIFAQSYLIKNDDTEKSSGNVNSFAVSSIEITDQGSRG